MKFDKWTVVLATLGVVSLASAAKAEEKTSSVMTALSSTTISGYVDTSAQWNIGNGNQNVPPYKFDAPSKADGFNLDVVQLRIEKPMEAETPWAAGYRADLWFGPDANTLNTQSIFGSPSQQAAQGDFAIRQAYVTLRAPVGNGLEFKVGVFDSIIGYESVESDNNPNYTRSYGHSFEPQTETGALASYRFSDVFSVSGGVANTVGPSINERPFAGGNVVGATKAESYKAYMGSFALTAPESLGFLAGSTLYAGIVNGFGDTAYNVTANTPPNVTNGDQTSYYVGATMATPITGLRVGACFDYLDIYGVHGDTYSGAGYISYQATDKLSFHVRGEYLKDTAGFFDQVSANGEDTTVFPDRVLALTGTIQYDLWKNVLSRLEVRWDHSLTGQPGYGPTDVNTIGTGTEHGTLHNSVMVAANVIYKF